MKILKHYLCATILPCVAAIISGLIQMPSNCKNCVPLLIVGGGLLLGFYALINILYFLLYLDVIEHDKKILLGLVACVLPSIICSIILISSFYKSTGTSSDFNIVFPSTIISIIFGIWSFFKYLTLTKK